MTRPLRIVTDYDPKPIPQRWFDWSAIDDATYCGPGCPIGHGATEDEAIEDLMAQFEPEDPNEGIR